MRSEVGRGTVFKVFFPAHQGAALSDAQPPTLLPSGGGLVLLVDDDAAVRAVTRRMLEKLGFSVLEAADGERGVESFEARRDEIRVVILDMTMPEMGGEEALRELKKLRADVPVLLTSGYNEQEAAHRVAGQARVRFLQKPFAAEDLSRELAATLALEPQKRTHGAEPH